MNKYTVVVVVEENLIKTGEQFEEMRKFKEEATHVLEDAKFKVHRWESNIKELEDQNLPNPSKILGQVWDKEDNTLEIKIPPFSNDTPVTKKTTLSHLGKVYDPLGILSTTMAQGKHIYREACDEKTGMECSGVWETSESLVEVDSSTPKCKGPL